MAIVRDPQWLALWKEIIANVDHQHAARLATLTVRDGWFNGHHLVVVADEPMGSDFDGALTAAREAAWRIGQVRLTIEGNLAS